MKKDKMMDNAELIKKAIRILMRELGPVDAFRFLTLPRPKHTESVKRHRAWQKKLDPKEFLDQAFHTE
jgi:hypothetical protein